MNKNLHLRKSEKMSGRESMKDKDIQEMMTLFENSLAPDQIHLISEPEAEMNDHHESKQQVYNFNLHGKSDCTPTQRSYPFSKRIEKFKQIV